MALDYMNSPSRFAIGFKSPVDMNLDMTMPKKNTQTELETDSNTAKPVGLLSRVKDFLSGQVSQFAAEQTGTEDKANTSDIGRVLRSLVAAGATGVIGGDKAVQIGTGVAGTVRDIANKRQLAKQQAQALAISEEDRQLKNKNLQSEMDTRTSKANADMMDRIGKVLSSGADFMGLTPAAQERNMRMKNLQSQIDERSKLKEPKAIKPVEAPPMPFNTKDGISSPDDMEYKQRLIEKFALPLAGKIRASGAFRTPDELRFGLKDMKTAPELVNVPAEYRQFVIDSTVQQVFPGTPTREQQMQSLQTQNPPTGVFAQQATNRLSDIADLAKNFVTGNKTPNLLTRERMLR